jgi:hypothetical protein
MSWKEEKSMWSDPIVLCISLSLTFTHSWNDDKILDFDCYAMLCAEREEGFLSSHPSMLAS